MFLQLLQDYLAGAATLDSVQDAAMDILWDDPSDDPLERELAAEFELRLAELTGGHCSEDELKEAMEDFVGIVPKTVLISVSDVVTNEPTFSESWRSCDLVDTRIAGFG